MEILLAMFLRLIARCTSFVSIDAAPAGREQEFSAGARTAVLAVLCRTEAVGRTILRMRNQPP
jgi:hypothetical protein